MDDQSSVTSTLTYQATFEEQSNLDSSTSSTPKNSLKATVARGLQSSKLDSVDYRSASQLELQHDPTDRSAANLTPAMRPNNRGRSRSPRPVVSTEARARWAMLASLAGVSKDEDLSDDEEDGQSAPEPTKQSSDPFSDPRLRPLHILDPSGDAASIERYLHNLEKDPHVDSRLLQEGLQASKRLSNDYSKGQQATTRSRAHSSVTEQQATPQDIRQEVRNQQVERKRPGETSAEQDSLDRHRIVRAEPSVTASLPAKAQILKDKSRAIGHSVEHGLEDAKIAIEGDVSTSAREAEALSHTHGEHGIGEGLRTHVHGVEGAVESIGSELPVPNIRRDVGNDSRDLSLAGRKIMRGFRKDERDVNAGLRDTERLIENKLPGLDIRHEIRKSEHELKDGIHKLEGVDLTRDVKEGVYELKEGLHEFAGGDLTRDIRTGEHELKDGVHKLEGVDLMRDVKEGVHDLKKELHKFGGGDLARDIRTGEHDLDAGIRHAEKAVENALPGRHILQDVQKGEHELKVAVRVAEETIERDLKGPNLQRALRRGEHEIAASVNSIVKGAGNVLPDSERNIREGEQNLKNKLLRDASKVENALPSPNLHPEASKVATDLAKGFRKTADVAEREVRKADGRGLVNEFGKDGRAVELNLERLGTSVVGHVSKDEHALVKDTRAMGRSVENAGKDVKRSAGNGVRMGEQAVNQAMNAAADLQLLDNEGRQGRDGAPNRGTPSSPRVLPPSTGVRKPATSNRLTDMGEPSRLHSHATSEALGKFDERRGDLLNNKGPLNHGVARQNPPQAPFPLMAHHGPVRPPTNPAPAGLRAPYPTKNEPTRATMPTMPSESYHLSPVGHDPTQRRPGEIFHPSGSNMITPNSGQAAGLNPNPNQTGQVSVQSRLAGSAQAPRANMINPRLSQSAIPPSGPSSFRPDQQRSGGKQSRDQVSQPSLARPQGDRSQALSTNRPAQPGQTGTNPPSISNVKVPPRMPPPRLDAANSGPRYRQEPRAQGIPNDQLGKGTPPQQGSKPAQNPQVIRQNNPVPSGQHSKPQEPGIIAQLSMEDQRRTQIQGDGKAAAKPLQDSLSQTKALKTKGNNTILPVPTQRTEDEPESQRKGHRANVSTQKSESHSAAKRFSQTTTEVPSPVSGPQQMLNMFKARSQASIDEAGGCPGFVDRKSPHLPIRYLRAKSQS